MRAEDMRANYPVDRARRVPTMSRPAASVIVSTYNRPGALAAVLHGLAAQSRKDFEVIVCDDGSTPFTRQTVRRLMDAFGGRLHYLWHEDRGFRAAAARNRAIERAQGVHLCFLDGDCVPRHGFVHGHLCAARPGVILRGSRLLLSRELTRACERSEALPHEWDRWSLRRLVAQGKVNRMAPVLGGAMDGLRRLGMVFRGRNWRLMRGCNFSVRAEAMRAVGGFDESYEGWGYEDSDLCVRLLHHGLRIRQAPADTCVLHLWHEERDRGEEPANRMRLQEVLGTRRVQAVRGLRTAPATAQGSHFV